MCKLDGRHSFAMNWILSFRHSKTEMYSKLEGPIMSVIDLFVSFLLTPANNQPRFEGKRFSGHTCFEAKLCLVNDINFSEFLAGFQTLLCFLIPSIFD